MRNQIDVYSEKRTNVQVSFQFFDERMASAISPPPNSYYNIIDIGTINPQSITRDAPPWRMTTIITVEYGIPIPLSYSPSGGHV
ncbi:hypothetical protein FRB91_000500 [Serendipita sp. 411]|nr:hypothetical protein FRC18_006597 [Serendipita sp. 400]KAG8846745.1 hypothetical protein FRB91_000500 [Serendipita sp. 411]